MRVRGGRLTRPPDCRRTRLLVRLFLSPSLDEAEEPGQLLETTAANREFKSQSVTQHPWLVRVQTNVPPSQGVLCLQFWGAAQKAAFSWDLRSSLP